ncbi:hypothetical protein GOP47_0001532 [Adiantum capillus-veneris]|uniref:SWIM-type domain-containing protein n=1 Tax=Adiantum capillus-veneris TaxID=13818 RepID=A0A9D4ZNC4_ADICA|nr:hypothetical protein GOP47_0001532 [Adiantum capillus-veneris]
MLPLPAPTLFPSSLKFLWFGRENPSKAPDQTSPMPPDVEDANNNQDLTKACTCFIDTDDSGSHTSNVAHTDTFQTSNVEDTYEVDKQIAIEMDSLTPRKHVVTGPDSRISWISRILQLRLRKDITNCDQLKNSKELLESSLSNIAEKEAEKTPLLDPCEDFSELINGIAVHKEQNGASSFDCNDNEDDDVDLGLCTLETSEERVVHDRESVSMFLHEVPVAEVQAISKLCFLSNLAYIIPEVQSKGLLKDHHLAFVTSSLVKKEEAEAHASLERAIMQANKQKRKAKKHDGQKCQVEESNPKDSFDQGVEPANYDKAASSREDMRLLPPDAILKAGEEASLKAQSSCPCEWFICDDEASNTRYLVIQGSESLAAWQTNLSFDPTKFEGLLGVLVHRGVYEAAQGLYQLVEKEMVEHARKGSHARLCFTGHSLGGSLATLIAMMLVRRGAVGARAVGKVVTLGAPCVLCAGERVLQQLRLQEQQFVNVVMHRDIVPRAFACDYPLHVVRLLQRLNGTFRDHPCLNVQHVLYTPVGQMMILQPENAQSPRHPLLPSKACLYLINNPPHEEQEQEEAMRALREAQRAFFNMPHPLDVLRDLGAYGFEGAISRDHDPRSYKQALNTVLIQGLRRLGKLKRQSRHFVLTRKVFWCAYGPKDSSETTPHHPSVLEGEDHIGDSSNSVPVSTRKRRAPLTKGFLLKGCLCHFSIKRLAKEQDVAVISYIHPYHTNKSDEVCHGSSHPDASLKFSPWISLHKKIWVSSMLYRGFSPQQVMEKHIQALHTQKKEDPNYKLVRDDFLCIRDIMNIGSKLSIDQYQMHDNDAESVRRWCNENTLSIFIYQSQDAMHNVEFMLGIQTPWQRDICYKYGNGNLLAMDSTFGTNKYKFYLYTILVFDSHRNGVPIAWILTSSGTFQTTCTWLTSFRNHMLDHFKSWEPGAFMVDDAETEIGALRNVFHVPILLCLWHVKRCWLKHLIKKVKDWPTRADMFRALGMIMNMYGQPTSSEDATKEDAKLLLESFYSKYKEEEEFILYFKTYWESKIGMWIRATCNFPHAGQDTNGAIEAYHGHLKYKFLGSSKRLMARRVDWLLHKLTTTCLPFYWFMQQVKDNGFKRNNAIENAIENSYQRALGIPDGYVRHMDSSSSVALVQSITTQGHFHTVFNADCDWACCTCRWAKQGNVCNHQIKVILMKGDSHSSLIARCLLMYSASNMSSMPRGNRPTLTGTNSDHGASSPTIACNVLEGEPCLVES